MVEYWPFPMVQPNKITPYPQVTLDLFILLNILSSIY